MINISEKYKFFLWMPPKTGSTRASEIFRKLGFVSKQYERAQEFIPMSHNHDIELFEGSENYKLISLGRNPYSKMVSYFKASFSFYSESDQEQKEKFLNFLSQYFYFSDKNNSHTIWGRKYKNYWDIRTPDYYIRIENMFEDYLKIPFVRGSEIYKTGELEKMCNIKVNENLKNRKFWKEYYCDETADMVYYNFSKYFEKLGYDKDSYKF